MAGHSHWAKIKRAKGANDAKRGKIWSKVAKKIMIAAKNGGDPRDNLSLRYVIDEAKGVNMPKDTIEKAIKKGTGDLEGQRYETVRYEAYAPGGVAMIIDCLTDNRTRTVAEVRHAFSKNGGNLGSDGSVGYLFKHVGQFIFAPGTSEDKLMEAALEAGADDVVANEDGSIEVLSPPHYFPAVKAALEKAGFRADLAEVTMKPASENALSGGDAQRMRSLLDTLEALDDVQNVYTTAVID